MRWMRPHQRHTRWLSTSHSPYACHRPTVLIPCFATFSVFEPRQALAENAAIIRRWFAMRRHTQRTRAITPRLPPAAHGGGADAQRAFDKPQRNAIINYHPWSHGVTRYHEDFSYFASSVFILPATPSVALFSPLMPAIVRHFRRFQPPPFSPTAIERYAHDVFEAARQSCALCAHSRQDEAISLSPPLPFRPPLRHSFCARYPALMPDFAPPAARCLRHVPPPAFASLAPAFGAIICHIFDSSDIDAIPRALCRSR